MQLSTVLPPLHIKNAENYVFVQARNQVMRLVLLQPFQGLSGQFSFLGYVTHAYHLSPLYWPEECCGLADELLQQVGLLSIADDISRYTIYEVIEHGVKSPWGRPYKLARYLYTGCLLVGIPTNPFNMPSSAPRQLITTTFLKALFFNNQTYESLCKAKLRVKDEAGKETLVDWSYLGNRFMDFYIDFTSELRKVARGYLQKGIVGVITTLIYQGLTHPAQHKSHLKAPMLFPIVMTALNDMYKHPADFNIFFKEAHKLLFLQEANVLVLEPKHGIPKVMLDGWRKTLEDIKPIEFKHGTDTHFILHANYFALSCTPVREMVSYDNSCDHLFKTLNVKVEYSNKLTPTRLFVIVLNMSRIVYSPENRRYDGISQLEFLANLLRSGTATHKIGPAEDVLEVIEEVQA
ncbi:hypothetical protein P692DRAFT_20822507 [Suillus brevipes Sb2]|nr:hypothetical protein P692DRAFT_20822507 [Suillus brevipes Sb2]